ncbi:MAG: hypothetical protein IPF96_06190 [Rhodobacter sp.]|nr:hypothetical protein [Rhodobacter sp.]
MALAIRKNLQVPANDTLPEEHSCSQTIASLIEQYDYVEKLCEVAIGQQEGYCPPVLRNAFHKNCPR